MLARCWQECKLFGKPDVEPMFISLDGSISASLLRSLVTEYRASYRAILDQATPGTLFAGGSKSAERVGRVLA